MAPCVCQLNPIFQPSVRCIASITNSNPALITTTNDHLYFDGMIVRLVIPPACGMQQADKLTGEITCTGATTFTINIDTSLFDAFSVPVLANPHIDTNAMILPIGENPNTTAGAAQNTLN